MERFTVTANVNGCLTQRPSFNPNVPISLPVKPHRKDTTSSYLRPHNPIPIPNGDTEISIFGAERYFNDGGCAHDQKALFDPVVVVERCDLPPYHRDSSVSSVDEYGRKCRHESFHVTPTASSEASWNSQSGLLTNPPGSVAVTVRAFPSNEQRRVSSSARRWLFGRSCPCSGKRSVDVEEKYSEPKSPKAHSNFNSEGGGGGGSAANHKKQSIKTVEVNGFVIAADRAVERNTEIGMKLVPGSWEKEQESFQSSSIYSPENHFPASIGHRIVNSNGPFNDGSGFSFPILTKPMLEDPPRDSLEVFRPKDEMATMSVKKSAEFQQWKPTPLPSDTTCQSFGFPSSPKGRVDDDLASDSSSDLFEIESFTTHTTSGPTYRRRDSLDEILAMDPRRFAENAAGILQLRNGLEEPARPSNAPSDCYPPSEVSIQWSVTTAEGFDQASTANFSSAVSDYEEAAFIRPDHDKFATTAAGVNGRANKKKGNGLLSCRCEKAVSVGPHPVRYVPEPRRAVFSAETGPVSGKSRLGNRNNAMHLTSRATERPPLARSHSSRMTRPIQTR